MTANQPRAITTQSSQTNGINATTNEVKKNVVATLFLIRRRSVSGRNTTGFTGWSSASMLVEGLTR